jgi:hypothetical protein
VVSTPSAQIQTISIASTEPKELDVQDYEPITDPANVKRYVADYFSDIPLLADIAACESHDRQVLPSGNIVRGEVNRYDIGVMQINELYHADEAKAQGDDLYTIQGNVAFARYLYDKEGAKPWMSSSGCWSKTVDSAIAQS